MIQKVTYSYAGHRWFGWDNDYVPQIGSVVKMTGGRDLPAQLYIVQQVVVRWEEEDEIFVRSVSVRLKTPHGE